jgi:hypothetical protein
MSIESPPPTLWIPRCVHDRVNGHGIGAHAVDDRVWEPPEQGASIVPGDRLVRERMAQDALEAGLCRTL